MKTLNPLLITLFAILLFIPATLVPAQEDVLATPRSEKLLNELNVLIWSTAGTDRVTVRLRINNGAAFDPKDKAGTFAMLGEILFPEEGIREFFREELGGELTVKVTYDYVEVTGTAKADEFLSVLETLAPALMNTEIDKETTAKVRAKQLDDLSSFLASPDYLPRIKAADLLFGEFPYGRPVEGSRESLEKIDFADLIYLRERFLTADNATLSIIGDVRSDYAYLAARRLMGGWNKAGTNIPATFRLPEAPDKETKTYYVEGETANRSAVSIEGFARNSKLYHASKVLESVIASRLDSETSSEEGLSAKAVSKGFLIKGVFEIFTEDLSVEATVPGSSSRLPARKTLEKWLALPVTENEFQKAKASYFAKFSALGPDELMADVSTYNLASPKDELDAVREIRLEDVKAAVSELAKRPSVEVVYISRPPVVPDVPADTKDPR